MEYRIIVLNLERRKDRWDYSYKKHLANGTPPEWIERWKARDGLDWKKDAWKQGEPYPELKAAALAATNGTPFLDKDPTYISDYCWQWSFYEAIMSIAAREADKLYLFMLDDFSLTIDHESLQSCVNLLEAHAPDFRLM